MTRICSAKDLTRFVDQLKRKIDTQPSSEAILEIDTALEELKIAEETVHQQAEALAKALERADGQFRRYLDLFEFAPDGYCVTDARGTMLEANWAMCELLGLSAEAIVGKPLLVFIPRDLRRDMRNFILRVSQSRANALPRYPIVWQAEFGLRPQKPVPVSVRCSLSREGGENPRLLWLLRDVTEQKRAEQILECVVEQKTSELQERLQELEAFHDVTVERELRMIELEKKVKTLESGKAGEFM
ncbi:PAS domain S-box protein [Nitrospira sp. Nam74]